MVFKEDVTRLLVDLSRGKEGANEALFSILYNELHAQAKRYMQGEKVGHTLQTTALVHEAYLRLCVEKEMNWESRAHFLRIAARAMRRVLIDHARKKQSEKRGGDLEKKPFKDTFFFVGDSSVDILVLDKALNKLLELDPRSGQIVELRFFAGLKIEETANVLGISPSTVKSDWRMARAWLKNEISEQ